MSAPRVAAHFEDLDKQAHAERLGVWIFLASELLLFGGLFALYFSYRLHFPRIFAEGVDHNARLLGTINTFVLLAGSACAAFGVDRLRRDRVRAGQLLVGATALTAVAFLTVKAIEYAAHLREGIGPGGAGRFFDAHPERGWAIFFTLYYAMTGLHAIHVALGGALFAAVAAWIGRRRVGSAGAWRVELAALYWHFVDAVWVFLWPLFYLLGSGS